MEGHICGFFLHGWWLFTPSPRAGSRGWMPTTALRVLSVCIRCVSCFLQRFDSTWEHMARKIFSFFSMEMRLLFLNYGIVARLISSHKLAWHRGKRDRARLSESCEWSPAARTTTMSHTHQRVWWWWAASSPSCCEPSPCMRRKGRQLTKASTPVQPQHSQ